MASSLLNVDQQVGGGLGLAVLGTVAWDAVANSLRSQAAAAAAPAKTATVHLAAAEAARCRRVLRPAGITLPGLSITLVAIGVRREDLAGSNPMAAPAG